MIPDIVMAEFLMGDVEGEKMIAVCKKLCGSFLPITEKELNVVAKMPTAIRKKLKANDCLILAFAQRYKAELFTFDQTLKKTYASFS